MTTVIKRKRNRDKSLYRWFLAVSVFSLFLFFWLNIADKINLVWYNNICAYAFLAGLTAVFTWLLKKEKDPDNEKLSEPESSTNSEKPES